MHSIKTSSEHYLDKLLVKSSANFSKLVQQFGKDDIGEAHRTLITQ